MYSPSDRERMHCEAIAARFLAKTAAPGAIEIGALLAQVRVALEQERDALRERVRELEAERDYLEMRLIEANEDAAYERAER